MSNTPVVLTAIDHVILESYKNMLDGFSTYLGGGYEIVLHNLEDYAHSAIKVVNGFHTGRTEGAPITDLALQMLEKMRKQKGGPQAIIYFTQNPKGEPLKSTTIPILGEKNRIIGLLCINFYLNTTIHQIVRELSAAPASLDAVQHQEYPENFTANVSALIENSVSAVQQEVNQDHSIPSAAKNKEIVRRLDAKGIFALKDGVVKSAELLQISKNTVYLHLRNLANESSS